MHVESPAQHASRFATARCTQSLQAQLALLPRRNCTGRVECKRLYDVALLNCSAAEVQAPRRPKLHEREIERDPPTCRGGNKSHYVLPSGGWCLSSPVDVTRTCRGFAGTQKNSDCMHTEKARGAMGNTTSYYLPRHHVYPDERIVQLLSRLLLSGPIRLSVNDFGAGVGSYGHALRAIDRRAHWMGFDGAGNVAEVTGGAVRWFDLTQPLRLRMADWVMSLEVGEHIPNHFEAMVIRNLHAHNCRGIVLSWGQYQGSGGAGHGDANYHTTRYLVDLFDSLGYRYLEQLTQQTRAAKVGRPSVNRHSWFSRTLHIFERRVPLAEAGCAQE